MSDRSSTAARWRVRVDLFAADDGGAAVSPTLHALRTLLHESGDMVPSEDSGADQGLGIERRPVVGLVFWVRAEDVGDAARKAVAAARRAGTGNGVGPDLYDVTVIPDEAVARPGDPGYPSMPD